jgi:hypothetical protein
VLRIRDVYSGSEFFLPGSRIQGQKDSGSASKNITQKIVSKLSEYDAGCSSPIPDPYLDFLPIPDPGVQKAPDPGCGSGALIKLHKKTRQGSPKLKQDRL